MHISVHGAVWCNSKYAHTEVHFSGYIKKPHFGISKLRILGELNDLINLEPRILGKLKAKLLFFGTENIG